MNNKFFIKTRKNLFLNTTGEHQSIFNGDGLDFKEIREYTTGDDIRHLNWNVTAKIGKPSVNIFNEEKQLNIVLVYLNSGSIYFGSNKSKQDVMTEVMTLLGTTAINQNDLLTSIFFTTKEEKFFKATSKMKIVDINFNTAYDLNPIGNSINYDKLELYLLNKIKSKSLIFLIGDFLEMPSLKLLSKKHEVLCVIVRDKLEEKLKFNGEFNIIDTNTLSEDLITLDQKSIDRYNKIIKNHDKNLITMLSKLRVKFKKIYTHDNVFIKLRSLVTS